jgi:hypothetical protein
MPAGISADFISAGAAAAGADLYAVFFGAADCEQPEKAVINTTRTLTPDKKYRIPHLLLEK